MLHVEKIYTVPHLKALNSGKEPLQGKGRDSTFTISRQPRNVLILLHIETNGQYSFDITAFK